MGNREAKETHPLEAPSGQHISDASGTIRSRATPCFSECQDLSSLEVSIDLAATVNIYCASHFDKSCYPPK